MQMPSKFGELQKIYRQNIHSVMFVSALAVFGAGGIGISLQANAETKSIPTAAISKANDDVPAADLIYDNKPIDPERAADLRAKGTDLATLDPDSSDVWQPKSYSVSNVDEMNYPEDGATIQSQEVVRDNINGFRANITYNNQSFRLILSLNSHAAMARAALLRKVGYPVQSPKYYRRLRVEFESLEAKEEFVSNIAIDAEGAGRNRWVLEDNKDEKHILIQDGMLEPAEFNVPSAFYMGVMDSSRLQDRRYMRALLIPFVLMDISENVDLFSYEAAKIFSGNITMNQAYADKFQGTDYDDCRWMLARMASFTRKDWKEIVNTGAYPSDISALIVEKIIARRNTLMTLFNMQNLVGSQAASIAYSKTVNLGYVQNGKATKANYDGYALRFRYGDPSSPITGPEIARFVKIKGLSALLGQAVTRLNEKLEVRGMEAVMKNRSTALMNRLKQHFGNNPNAPFSMPITSWGGIIGGPMIRASRDLVTGSYYGTQSSDFQVQLVDQISASARIGYYRGWDGINNLAPSVSPQVSFTRTYVHVRPVPSIEAASKQSWKDLYIPSSMNALAETLKYKNNKDETARLDAMKASLAKFLDKLKDQETFTVIDSYSLGVTAQANVPLAAVLNMNPLNYVNSVVLGLAANQFLTKRTVFIRENGLIKIYAQDVSSQALSASLDFNWWMNIWNINRTEKWGKAATRAYHLSEAPSDLKETGNFISAVTTVLEHNSTEELESLYRPYVLDHRLKDSVANGKFLWTRWYKLAEEHRVSVVPPLDDAHKNEDPKKYTRSLYRYKILDRTGQNYYAFLSDVLDGLVQNSSKIRGGILGSGESSNPSDTFLGESKWSEVATEVETTKSKEEVPVTLSQHYWTGWTISKKALFSILNVLDKRLKSLRIGFTLVNRDEFAQMKSLQLYQIRSTLALYSDGVKRLKEIFLSRTVTKKGKSFWRRLGGDSWSASDKQLVDNVLIPLAGGKARFDQQCLAEFQKANPETQFTNPIIYAGNSYECLLPWMQKVLKLRRELPDFNDRERSARWTTRLVSALEENADLGQLLQLIGEKNLFYVIKVSGFRTHDENGDTADYTSSSYGTYNSTESVGIFSDFVNNYGISSSELNASYLSEGN